MGRDWFTVANYGDIDPLNPGAGMGAVDFGRGFDRVNASCENKMPQ